MDETSKEQKLEWLTTTDAPIKRAMINTVVFKDSWQVPKYTVTQFRRQIDRPSFGNLGKLAPELLCMVFRNLTCDDLEALHCCSTGGRIAVLAFPQYHRLLKHCPTILAILKETQLARYFTIAKIYETFASTLCAYCSEFGGYVFLPSFTRCCIHCAETKLRFLPISRDAARRDFGVKGKRILDNLPQLSTIEGHYSSTHGRIEYYEHRLSLFSREVIKNVPVPEHIRTFARDRETFISDKRIKTHERYMALTPLPCYIPESASIEKGMYCVGCAVRAKDHFPCVNLDWDEYDEWDETNSSITDGSSICCWMGDRRQLCFLGVARDKLHDSRLILGHLEGCVGAQAVLQIKWAQSQESLSEKDT